MPTLKLVPALVFIVAAAHATTVNISFTTMPVVQMSYLYAPDTGTYNGISGATIDGIPNESLICDDFADNTTFGNGATDVYNYSTLNLPAPLQYAMFSGGNIGTTSLTQTQAYDVVAVLLSQLETYVSGAQPDAQTITDYNYAIWNLFSPYSATNTDGAPATAGSSIPSSPGSLSLQTAAWNEVQNPAGSTVAVEKELVIYTPTAAYKPNQEFLGLATPTPTPPVPEPNLGLLAGGLLLALTLGRRRFAAPGRRREQD